MDSQLFTFDDVLIAPGFSDIKSRKEVDLTTYFGNARLSLPVISANMDTVTGEAMANAMANAGGIGCLHRFGSIDDNVRMFKSCMWPNGYGPATSVGLGEYELERAVALADAGATNVVIDVAHGAQLSVVEQAQAIYQALGDRVCITVGNFATGQSIKDFNHHLGAPIVRYYKVGVGPGSACTTRIKTGIGVPQLSAIMDCAATGVQVIADGGLKTPGDIAKALGAGAELVMIGGMLSGTTETPGDVIEQGAEYNWDVHDTHRDTALKVKDGKLFKKYRGSASKESYEAQGKDSSWRTAEGEAFLVPCKGPAANVLQDIEGGLRSSMTYVGARNLHEFKRKCMFNLITTNSTKENGAHGKQ